VGAGEQAEAQKQPEPDAHKLEMKDAKRELDANKAEMELLRRDMEAQQKEVSEEMNAKLREMSLLKRMAASKVLEFTEKQMDLVTKQAEMVAQQHELMAKQLELDIIKHEVGAKGLRRTGREREIAKKQREIAAQQREIGKYQRQVGECQRRLAEAGKKLARARAGGEAETVREVEEQIRAIADRVSETARRARRARVAREETELRIEQALDLLALINPPEAEELRKLRNDDRDEFRKTMGQLLGWLEDMRELRDDAPEVFELEKKSHCLTYDCRRLANEARAADGDKREDLVEEMRQRVGNLFEARFAISNHRIQRIERELKKLRADMEAMSTQSEDMIDRYLERLLNDRDR
jgi:hypothetical protein